MMVPANILGLTFNHVHAGAYALIVAEEGGAHRRIPIIIGTPEAQAIAIYLEGLNPPRPLTHDLFIGFVRLMDMRIDRIDIFEYEDGIFRSQVVIIGEKRHITLEARTSDAVALAIRYDAPVFVAPEILDEIGYVVDNKQSSEDFPDIEEALPVESLQPEDLQKKLDEAIANEDFEKASCLRDLIRKHLEK
jgi:bifunctional DNase/RNase